MKTRLLLFFICVFSISTVSAQMRVQQDENTVTFNFDDANDVGEWDANGNPIYLYLFIPSSEASNGVSSEPLGAWPGTPMNDLGGDLYKITINLANFYPDGTTIFEILFTYNDNMGNQNPIGEGFNATDFSYVPLTTLSTLDFEQNEITFNIINGKLVVSQNETVSVSIYNITGQRIKTFTNINLDANSSLDLNLNKNQLYLVRIKSQNGIQVIKTVK